MWRAHWPRIGNSRVCVDIENGANSWFFETCTWIFLEVDISKLRMKIVAQGKLLQDFQKLKGSDWNFYHKLTLLFSPNYLRYYSPLLSRSTSSCYASCSVRDAQCIPCRYCCLKNTQQWLTQLYCPVELKHAEEPHKDTSRQELLSTSDSLVTRCCVIL